MFATKAGLAGLGMLAVVATTILLPMVGCGPTPVQHDQAASYTAESLAQELAYRVQNLRNAKAATPRPQQTKTEIALEDRIRGAADDATKAAPEAQTLDNLLDDTMSKARTIRGQALPDVAQAIIAAIRANTTLNDAEKSEIVAGIEARSKAS